MTKKLIEVALPLEAINAESAREKSIRHGHPSTLHLWWARRPLAAARAVIWSSLVDDPSSHPEQFPTEEAQNTERERLFGILTRLVKWENSNNQDVLDEAKAEILRSTNGCPPALLDPFAGGGSIPLEAQRLGLEAHASDLNPVAVMINKAMIEIPPKFAGNPPVNPYARSGTNYSGEWKGAQGLAEDVRYYGEWMKKEAFKRIGHLYPKVKDEHGQEHTVIAWIWARTVKCPNPACGCEMPLASSFELSKKKGKEAYIQPIIESESSLGSRASSPHWHSRGYLPHFESLCAIQFITFRLHDSVPASVVRDWKVELKITNQISASDDVAIELRKRIDTYEDAGYGNCYLRDEQVAKVVEDALLHFDGERYILLEWCIMPNHVHVLIETRELHSLSSILHSWKSFTAKKANELLNRTGDFWMPDYFDRYVRDERHLESVRAYICGNPVKAGLVNAAEAWRWSSAWERGHLARRCGLEARAPRIRYEVKYGKNAPEPPKIARGKFKCVCCGEPLQDGYTKIEGQAGRMGAALMAIVAEGHNGRLYISPDEEQESAAICPLPKWKPEGKVPPRLTGGTCVPYGLDTFDKLFTNRQLTALTTFSDLVAEAQAQVERDGGSRECAQAIGVYLAFLISKMADRGSSICSWDVSREGLRNTFGRQAIPMTWDFSEANPFCSSSGSYDNMLEWVFKVILNLPCGRKSFAQQNEAQSDNELRNIMVSTDPPYYDNIAYADLSDFFYVWLRHSIKNIYPDLFRTMFVPKSGELIAVPYRFGGSTEKARIFFEEGMLKTFKQVNIYVREDIPVTVYYAFKQSEADEDEEGSTQSASTGWETMLAAIIQAGFSITGTWPMRTEMANRAIGMGTNALASSIVLVCRKRPTDAPTCTRRDFINALKRDLKPALKKLQTSNIAPVDLAQSAIGPGMGVYSRFSKVLEADGTPMSVRSALQIINQELDLYFTEQDGELDRDSRFCVDLFSQYAFNDVKFGEADVLARAKDTSVEKLVRHGILYAQKGVVRLRSRGEIPEKVDHDEQIIWLLTQQLTCAMEIGGVVGAAKIVADFLTSEPDQAKALAYRLFTLADRKGWAPEANAYNSLVIAWPEVQSKAAELRKTDIEQFELML